MSRVKRGVQAKKRHKKILKLAKGYRGARSRTFKVANQAVVEQEPQSEGRQLVMVMSPTKKKN